MLKIPVAVWSIRMQRHLSSCGSDGLPGFHRRRICSVLIFEAPRPGTWSRDISVMRKPSQSGKKGLCGVKLRQVRLVTGARLGIGMSERIVDPTAQPSPSGHRRSVFIGSSGNGEARSQGQIRSTRRICRASSSIFHTTDLR